LSRGEGPPYTGQDKQPANSLRTGEPLRVGGDGRQAFRPAPLLVYRDVIWLTQGVQQGDPLCIFLFAAGTQDALDGLPPIGALHRWYLDHGVIMGSIAEVEGVLTALQRTQPPL